MGMGWIVLPFSAGVIIGFLAFVAIGADIVRRERLDAQTTATRAQIAYEHKAAEMRRRGGTLVVRIESDDRGPRWAFFDSIDRDTALYTLRLARHKSFSEREMSHLSRSQFRAFRSELMRRGMLRWVDPSHRRLGVEWTSAGEAALRAVEEERFEIETEHEQRLYATA